MSDCYTITEENLKSCCEEIHSFDKNIIKMINISGDTLFITYTTREYEVFILNLREPIDETRNALSIKLSILSHRFGDGKVFWVIGNKVMCADHEDKYVLYEQYRARGVIAASENKAIISYKDRYGTSHKLLKWTDDGQVRARNICKHTFSKMFDINGETYLSQVSGGSVKLIRVSDSVSKGIVPSSLFYEDEIYARQIIDPIREGPYECFSSDEGHIILIDSTKHEGSIAKPTYKFELDECVTLFVNDFTVYFTLLRDKKYILYKFTRPVGIKSGRTMI